MKLAYILVLFICGYTVGNLTTQVRLINHIDYMINVITETVKRVEGREWCNLKVPDAEAIAVDEIVLGRHKQGNVLYKNGFVVSIREIGIPMSVNQQVTLNAARQAHAIVTGTLRMHDVAIGYDVQANMEDGVHRYTAKHVYATVTLPFTIIKILNSDTLTVTVDCNVTPGFNNLPEFMPMDRLSDTLTTLFNATEMADGILPWANSVFQPIAAKVIATHVPFPEVCYDCSA